MQTEPDKNISITNHDRGIPVETAIQHEAKLVKTPRAYTVKPCTRSDITEFMNTWHYSHSIAGLTNSYCFGMYYKDELIGAMIYGRMAMKGQSVKYWDDNVLNAYKSGLISYQDADSTVLELRRLACIDDTCRNAESYFIGQTIKWLKRNAPMVRIIISYADEQFGHHGIIYKAANFKHVGMTAPGRIIILDEPLDDTDTGESMSDDTTAVSNASNVSNDDSTNTNANDKEAATSTHTDASTNTISIDTVGHSNETASTNTNDTETNASTANHVNTAKRYYHDHALREKYNGELKPFSVKLRKALDDGRAHYERTPGKNIYEYRLCAPTAALKLDSNVDLFASAGIEV